MTELEALVRLYGGEKRAFKAPWTRTTFPKRYVLLTDRWSDDPKAREYLDYIYEVMQRRNNLLLHSSPSGYRQAIVAGEGNRQRLNRAGPDGRWVQALSQGAGGFYLAGRVFAEEFGFDKTPMAQSFERATSFCRQFDELIDITRMAPGSKCPCGSGLVVSECHRS